MELIEWCVLIILTPFAFWCLIKWFEISDKMVKRIEKKIDGNINKNCD